MTTVLQKQISLWRKCTNLIAALLYLFICIEFQFKIYANCTLILYIKFIEMYASSRRTSIRPICYYTKQHTIAFVNRFDLSLPVRLSVLFSFVQPRGRYFWDILMRPTTFWISSHTMPYLEKSLYMYNCIKRSGLQGLTMGHDSI